ncbi:hypothetical protein [Caniella muris]|uniref:hypothetical protein n=1 Tax=Caniella muris TaxID=2941502 RepID=UPI00203DFBDD|nr:hypothetical protein [Caniella muris]
MCARNNRQLNVRVSQTCRDHVVALAESRGCSLGEVVDRAVARLWLSQALETPSQEVHLRLLAMEADLRAARADAAEALAASSRQAVMAAACLTASLEALTALVEPAGEDRAHESLDRLADAVAALSAAVAGAGDGPSAPDGADPGAAAEDPENDDGSTHE